MYKNLIVSSRNASPADRRGFKIPQKNRRKSFQPRATRGAFDQRILREKDDITFSADPS